MRNSAKAVVAAAAVIAGAVSMAVPAAADSNSVYFCQIDRGLCQQWVWVAPAAGCRNLPQPLPWEYVDNYSNQGQIIYSGPNCSTINGQGPWVLSPTNHKYEAYGHFRSYKHT
ncbi:hypothetical protein ACWEHA_33580 [Amycolatopsis nivea]